MKVMFCGAGKSSPFFRRVIQSFLNDWGGEVEGAIFIIGDRYYFDLLSREPAVSKLTILYQHADFNPFLARPVDPARLKAFEDRYGIPHLWRYVVSERLLEEKTMGEKVVYLYSYLEYFDSLYNRFRPDVFVGGDIDCLPAWVSNEIFRINGAVTLQMQAGRLPGRVHIGDNAIEQLPYFRETFEALMSRSLAPEEENRAKEILDNYRIRKQKPSYFKTYKRNLRPNWLPRPLAFFAAFFKWVKYPDEFFDIPFGAVLRQSFFVRFKTLCLKLFRTPIGLMNTPSDEKYFYFPLSLEPEVALLIINWRNRDQLKLLEHISESLPVGYKLYVKEHPGMLMGKRPWGFYRRIARIPSVRLIHPSVNSYEIIGRATGVITATGTVGIEAIAMGKPVVLLSRAAYESCSGVFRIRDLMELPGVLQALVKGFQADEENLKKFLLAYEQRTHPGYWGMVGEDSPGKLHPDMENPENERAIAQAITEEIRFRQARAGRPPHG